MKYRGNLKHLLKRQAIQRKLAMEADVARAPMTIPGDPMGYCIRYQVGARTLPAQHFRKKQYTSILKSHFKFYYRPETPVVLILRFYVPLSVRAKFTKAQLKNDDVPAARSLELCEYILSFLEMIYKALINCYRQVVKIDAEKYYSNNPRTEFQFLKWDHYVQLYRKDTVNAKSKSKRKTRPLRSIQPECPGHEGDPGVCFERPQQPEDTPIPGPSASGDALPDAATEVM